MLNQSYFNSITSESAFAARFQAEKGKPFAELPDSPASDWGREDLFACRVIRRPQQNAVLPILAEVDAGSSLDSDGVQSFLDGPDPEYTSWTEHKLVHKYGVSIGQIWAALSTFKRNPAPQDPGSPGSDGIEEKSDDGRNPKRARRGTLQDGFVDSGTLQVGSSSPAADQGYQGSQGSHSVSSVEYIDAQSHRISAPSEDETTHLMACVIRHILYFAPHRRFEDSYTAVEYHLAKRRVSTLTPRRERTIVAVDDGGLCLRQEMLDGLRIMKTRVALLEAKKRFQTFQDGRPVISDQCFAQMTCQALCVRLLNNGRNADVWPGESVIIIHATQHYLCFLQFHISDAYLKDFESRAPRSFISVHATPWYDLATQSGRLGVLHNLTKLVALAVNF